MKLKIKEIDPNPFKKQIHSGKLDEETIRKITANIQELGLMSPLPVVKIRDKHHLVYGHHRIEALKRLYGEDYEVDVELKDYDQDQMLRGMVVENLTQRSNAFREELDNLIAIKKYLENNPACSLSVQANRKDVKGVKDNGSCRDIAQWLDKNTGDVMKITKIADTLRIYDNLDKELLERVEKQSHAPGEKEEDDETIGVKVATLLSSFKDKTEQKDLEKAIRQSREQHGNKVNKNLTTYKHAPDEVKEQVRQSQLDLADVEDAILIYNKEKEEDETYVFQPNFGTQVKQFNKDVVKLEQQVAIFREIFQDNNFREKYHNLERPQRKRFNNLIYDIHIRIKNCYDEIESFMKQIPPDTYIEVKTE